MTTSFGNGVSRTLTPEQRNFLDVVFQRGKPPLDADINFSQQIVNEQLQQTLKGLMPSGFLIDPIRSEADFLTSQTYSNMFRLGDRVAAETQPIIWAFVNGWMVPVAGTSNTDGITNNIKLNPPPGSGSRIDYVFLEVWQALVSPNPSIVNKPSATTIWKYGNVEYLGTNVTDDLIDGSVGREVTKRVQLQYRIRVFGSGLGTTVSLAAYPDGLDDPAVLGQGSATAPVGAYTFTNMKDTLGDPGLWRAGDGNSNNALGTIDGYVYAIPICAVFRRNSSQFSSFTLAGTSNNNGGFNRNPSASFLAVPRSGAKELTSVTIVGPAGGGLNLTYDYVGDVVVNGLVDSGLDDSLYLALPNKFITIGTEVVSLNSINIGAGTINISNRGILKSWPTGHLAGESVKVFNPRPDGLFADEIAKSDILDLRHAVTPGEWDYNKILQHNFTALVKGDLKTSWKASGTGDTQGPTIIEVDLLHADGGTAPPPDVEVLDGPDGIRTIWSDAAVIQQDVSVLCDPASTLVNGFTASTYDATTVAQWEVGAGFKPYGFMNDTAVNPGYWANGTSIFLNLGGNSGSDGARATFRDGSTKAVRFVSPIEHWKEPYPVQDTGNQTPVTIRFINAPTMYHIDSAIDDNLGSYYPSRDHNFEKPFIFLGGLLNPAFKIVNLNTDPAPGAPGLVVAPAQSPYPIGPNQMEIDLGFASFDTPGNFFYQDPISSDFIDDMSQVAFPCLAGGSTDRGRTLWGMITNNGKDLTGQSSEVYAVVWGDPVNNENNGAFKIIGAGTLMGAKAANDTSIVVEPLSYGVTTWAIVPGQIVSLEIRSQYTSAVDGDGFALTDASAVVVLTDIGCETGVNVPGTDLLIKPWAKAGLPSVYESKMEILTSLLYSPGRSGFARVPKSVDSVSMYLHGDEYLRQDNGTISTFAAAAGLQTTSSDYTFFNPSVWNKLQCNGLSESLEYYNYGLRTDNSVYSPFETIRLSKYGGYVVNSEQDRETELMIDTGSKTVIFRPYQDRLMTIDGVTFSIVGPETLVGYTVYGALLVPPPPPIPKDGAGIFTAGLEMGYPVPTQYMPKFGRQDIPYYKSSSTTTQFLDGINHLFTDTSDATKPVFNVIGGLDNVSGGNAVYPMFFQAGTHVSGGSPSDYASWGTIDGTLPAYWARLTSDIVLNTYGVEISKKLNSVTSSDLGNGLKGIQLPPYLGIARLYGVYEWGEFHSAGKTSAFGPDRVTPRVGAPTNLLRKDADRQTLFILQDGAKDYTFEDGDHTYIIPSNVVDHTRISSYVAGDAFEDFDYVVEAVVFGFSKHWITRNNMVLARRHAGDGTPVNDGDNPPLNGIGMTIPCAAGLNSRVYSSYKRTPYQGDPYMTRNGATRVISDYENRYGTVDMGDSWYLGIDRTQFETDGTSAVEITNPRSFEVLSSIDFYTTLGTGKISGKMYPGTLMDCGYINDGSYEASRISDNPSNDPYDVVTRAFTEGQKENISRASVKLSVLYADVAIEDDTVVVRGPSGIPLTFTRKIVPGVGVPVEFTSKATGADTAGSLATSIQNTVLYDTYQQSRGLIYGSLDGSGSVLIRSVEPGAVGNNISVSCPVVEVGRSWIVLYGDSIYSGITRSIDFDPAQKYNLSGGVDLINNAGNGDSSTELAGMTEQLPLGILVNDSDFLSEDILSNGSSSFKAKMSETNNVHRQTPTTGLFEYDQMLNGIGSLVAMSDGDILQYRRYDGGAGTKKYCIYRGGGSAFVLSGENPGGPIDWVSESISASQKPVLKGAVLAGKAMLVRNYKETAFTIPAVTTYGDELQMVIVTHAIFGDGNAQRDGLNISGTISPTGYGEGYAAADRYRCRARPMYNGYSRNTPDPSTVVLAPYFREQ